MNKISKSSSCDSSTMRAVSGSAFDQHYQPFLGLSKVCDESAKPASESKTQMRTSETVIVYRNGRGTVSPSMYHLHYLLNNIFLVNSPIFAERRAMMDVSRTSKGSEKSKDKARGTRRPTSWVEANDLCSSVGGRKLTDGPYQRDGSANLPSLR